MKSVVGSDARQIVRRLTGTAVAVVVNVGLDVSVAVRVAVGVYGIVGVGVEEEAGGRVGFRVGVKVWVEVFVGVDEAVEVAVENNRPVMFQSNGSAITIYAIVNKRQEQINRKPAHPRINPVLRQSEGGGGGWLGELAATIPF